MSLLQVNLLGPLGKIDVEIEGVDIDHLWTFMKTNGFLDCIVAGSGGKRLRIDSDVVKAIVERDTSGIVQAAPAAPPDGKKNGVILTPFQRRQ